jgi:competence ComEA-like helix-hairpin-helix protein
MAKIPLRTYNQEIERLVENGRTDEAIAHCRYILQAYPRYVDVYRLLGKAFLETQRYGDAADIFQRVLSSIPDDFVAQVGMSIIREDEGNLDEAIWHMERAFEVQPANSAIQDELRRLYGRRDGIEPPKIRLTRGALARMYAKGDLYQQALAEIRAAFAENPNRIDLQVLMSDIYAKTGQQAEAIEAASAVFRKLPNCLIINQVMANLLQGTERDEEAKTFKNRLAQLDPYFTQVSTDAPNIDYVPDQAITIEKLDWKSGPPPSRDLSQPEWATSLGVELGEFSAKNEETLPDWLSGAVEQSTETSASKSTVPAFTSETEDLPGFDQSVENIEPESEEELPDWMKSAGWGVTNGDIEEPQTSPDVSEIRITTPSEEDTELAAAEIPDWLKAMAPPSATEDGEIMEEISEEVPEEEIEPWLDKILSPTTQDTGRETPQEGVIENWEEISPEVGESSGESGVEEFPDWLSEEASPAADSTVVKPDEGLPDWLLGEEQPAAEVTPIKPEAEIEPAEEIPDWAREGPISEADETAEELPDWLSEEMEPSSGAESAGDLPDWLLGEEQPVAEATPIEPEAEIEPAEEIPDWLREGPISETVESGEELPDWLNEEMEPSGEAESARELPDWLLSEEQPATEVTPTQPEADIEPAEEILDWAREGPISEAAETGEELPDWLSEETEPSGEAESADELPDWRLGEEEPVAEVTPIEPEAEIEPAEEIPDWLREESTSEAAESDEGLPDWLLEEREPSLEATSTEQVEEIETGEELPDWLTGETEPYTQAESAEELPDWLLGEEEPTGEIAPAGPVAQAEPAEEIPAWLFEEIKPEEAEQADASIGSGGYRGEVEESYPAVPTVEPVTSLDSREETPEWLIEEEESPTGLPISKPETEEELPDWLFEEKEEQPPSLEDTQPTKVAEPSAKLPDQIEDKEAPSAEAVVGEISAVEPSIEEPPDLEDTDAAFAWLESLAVKQGAEEALLLKPEERLEEPPEWVQKSAQAETVEAEEEEITSLEAAPIESETEGVEAIETGAPMDEEAAFAWLESLAAKQGVEEALLSKPEERSEEPPEWVREAARQEAAQEEISPPEPEELGPAIETPVGEPPQVEIEPSIETPEIVEEAEEAVAQVPSDMDEEAAFAWLESLAAKQGAEEALLLKPEERREEPPEWISKELTTAATEEELEAEKSTEAEVELEIEVEPSEVVSPLEEIAKEEIPSVEVEEEAAEEILPVEIEEEAVELTPETVTEEEGLLGKEEMDEILAMLEGEELSTEIVEKPSEMVEQAESQILEPIEEVPELPEWLSGPTPKDTGELEWKPPPIRLDINKASLIEFERLMGVGFRLAQQIINYRDANGPFHRVEDLQDVPGFDPATLDGIRDHLYVITEAETTIEEELTPLFIPTEDIPVEFTEARSTLIDGDLEEALEKYAQLIDAKQHLTRLIEDLQDITDRYPDSLNAWQYLGDAYLRVNQVQEALQAYIKAEELLR